MVLEKKMLKNCILIMLLPLFLSGCLKQGKTSPRLVMFVGIDVSGSYKSTPHFNDSLRFLSRYIHLHINGKLDQPKDLFVGTIGGKRGGKRKTFFPIESFQNKSVKGIERKLRQIFAQAKEDPITDFNAFFEQAALMIKERKLILRPISLVLLTDGIPDFKGIKGDRRYKKIQLKPLENLSRNVTVRVLYTTPNAAHGWQNLVPRKRVKVWTQDAPVMGEWKEVFRLKNKSKRINWIKRNVNFPVRLKRVD